jgi:hypothetical protein
VRAVLAEARKACTDEDFNLHGPRCGKTGGTACVERRRITGKPFEFKD